jgi:catechol 2,3-dioxygenase-like lactoylglutathione lyase family enzyme
MEVLASRILLRPADIDRSQGFYRDVLGLAVYREFGPPAHRGLVFFLGGGLLEVSGTAAAGAPPNLSLWLQVRDVQAEHQRLTTLGVEANRDANRGA